MTNDFLVQLFDPAWVLQDESMSLDQNIVALTFYYEIVQRFPANAAQYQDTVDRLRCEGHALSRARLALPI